MPILSKEQIRFGVIVSALFVIGLGIRAALQIPALHTVFLGYAQSGKITVSVTGAVAHPGTYTLPGGGSVADAVDAAGGLLPDAEATAFDETAQDGAEYYIPFRNAVSGRRININRANARELESLPLIGETKAQRIIAYRQTHGLFTNIMQLTQIDGIGMKTLERLRPNIEIGAANE